MKKIFCLFVIVLTCSIVNAQTQAIRDSIVGTYFCDVTFTGNNITTYYTDTIYPYKDTSDTIKFHIDDGQFCCWTADMILQNDSFFMENGLSYGYFYAPDSLYYFYNCLSPLGCYYNFYCHKISSSTAIFEELFFQNSIVISPNPASDKLSITSEINLSNIKLQVANIYGEIVFEKKYANIHSEAELDVSKIKNGIYFLSLIEGEKIRVYKFTVQH